jgi:hypothetical protein
LCCGVDGDLRGPRGKDVFARAPGVFGANVEGYQGSIPRAVGEDIFTSRMARELKIFPYGRNIADVLSAVMDKDRQDSVRKRRAITMVGDPMCELKRARGGAKSTAPGSSKPPPAAKLAVSGPSKSSTGSRAAASGAGKPPSAEPAKERRSPSPVRTDKAAVGGADFDTDIGVDDYLVGEFFFLFLDSVLNKVMVQGRMRGSWLLSHLRWRPLRLRWRLEQLCHRTIVALQLCFYFFVGGWAGRLGDFALCCKAMYILLTWNEVSLNVARSLLVTINRYHTLQARNFHAEVQSVNGRFKFIDAASTHYSVVGIDHVDDVEGDLFALRIGYYTERQG